MFLCWLLECNWMGDHLHRYRSMFFNSQNKYCCILWRRDWNVATSGELGGSHSIHARSRHVQHVVVMVWAVGAGNGEGKYVSLCYCTKGIADFYTIYTQWHQSIQWCSWSLIKSSELYTRYKPSTLCKQKQNTAAYYQTMGLPVPFI